MGTARSRKRRKENECLEERAGEEDEGKWCSIDGRGGRECVLDRRKRGEGNRCLVERAGQWNEVLFHPGVGTTPLKILFGDKVGDNPLTVSPLSPYPNNALGSAWLGYKRELVILGISITFRISGNYCKFVFGWGLE